MGKPRITLQHKPCVRVALQNPRNILQGTRTHQIVITHKEAILTASFLNKVTNIGVIAKILLVLVVVQYPGKALSITSNDRCNLCTLPRLVLANDHIEVLVVLGKN